MSNDYRALTINNYRLLGLDILSYHVDEIQRIWVKFWIQKNGPLSIARWGVSFQALDGRLDPSSTPLALHWDSMPPRVRLITASDIETFMRSLAIKVYHLHPVRDASDVLQWSSHSLQVGACVILHAMGFATLDIQWILRWRSMAFVAYLWNVAILACRQCLALDRASAMPHLV